MANKGLVLGVAVLIILAGIVFFGKVLFVGHKPAVEQTEMIVPTSETQSATEAPVAAPAETTQAPATETTTTTTDTQATTEAPVAETPAPTTEAPASTEAPAATEAPVTAPATEEGK